MRTALAAAAFSWLVAAPVAAEPLDALPALETAVVADILDGGTLALADGKIIRLADIEVPLPPLGRASAQAWPWAEAARSTLATLAAGRQVTVRGVGAAPDRYGRLTAQLVRDDGLWLEGALVEAGAVRVETTPGSADLAPELLHREAAARALRLGLWRDRFYVVRDPGALEHESGSFQIVEASIRSVEDRHGVVWLDLGGGASARLDRPARQRFLAAGLDPRALAGRPVRLRGWIEWQGRPIVILTHPQAVERLDTPPAD